MYLNVPPTAYLLAFHTEPNHNHDYRIKQQLWPMVICTCVRVCVCLCVCLCVKSLELG